MVIIMKPVNSPTPGEMFSIKTNGGVGTHSFSVKVNGKQLDFVQDDPDLTFTVPESAAGSILIKAQDIEGGLDSVVLTIKKKGSID